MVREIPRREARIVIPEHRIDGAPRVDPAMRPRHLPHPVQYAADLEIGREPKPAGCRQWHLDDALAAQCCEIGGAAAEPSINLGIVLAELWSDRAYLDVVADPDRRADMRHLGEL